MKKSLRIATLAVAICMILGAWAVVYAKTETEKNSAAMEMTTAVSGRTDTTTGLSTGTAIFQKADLFSDRDLQQTADLTKAVTYVVSDDEDISITAAGVYVLTGSAKNVTVTVEANKDDKVQLVLDGLAVTNGDTPAIYVKSADKVFVTTSADSSLSVTGAFAADGDAKVDGVIFSKSDLTLNGTATLTISSTKNGIVGKDDVKITGGTYAISAKVKAIEANDSIRIADGTLDLTAGTDGLHAENDEDNSKGYIYIGGGSVTVNAGDDGIHAATVVQVDDGTVAVTAAEGIEGTYVQLNGGTVIVNGQQVTSLPDQFGGNGGRGGWGGNGGRGGWGGNGGRGGH